MSLTTKLCNQTERTADVVAEGHQEAYQLTRRNFSRVVKMYPFMLDRIKEVSAAKLRNRNWVIQRISMKKYQKHFSDISDDGSQVDEEEPMDGTTLVLDEHKRLFVNGGLRVQAGDLETLENVWDSLTACLEPRKLQAKEVICTAGDRTNNLIFLTAGTLRCAAESTEHGPGFLTGVKSIVSMGHCVRTLEAGPDGAEVSILYREDLLGLCEVHEEMYQILPSLLEEMLCD